MKKIVIHRINLAKLLNMENIPDGCPTILRFIWQTIVPRKNCNNNNLNHFVFDRIALGIDQCHQMTQNWAKNYLWSHNSIYLYKVDNLVNGKDLLGECVAFLRI